MARWTTELTVLIALAAASAVIAPRVLIPHTPAPVRAVATHTTVSCAPELSEPAEPRERPAPEVVLGGSSPAADGPLEALDADPSRPTPAAERARGGDHGDPRAPTSACFSSGAIARRNGRWEVDLDRIPDPGHALAGVHLQPVGGEDSGEGFAITRTDSQGLLRAAGIRPGDVLVAVNGMPTLNPDQALDVLARYRRATSLSFRFRRGEGAYTVNVDTRGDTRRLHGPLLQAAMPTRGS